MDLKEIGAAFVVAEAGELVDEDADADAELDAEETAALAELEAEEITELIELDAEEMAELIAPPGLDDVNAVPVALAVDDKLVLVRILTTPPGLLELNALPVALTSAVVELARPPGFSDVMAWVVTLPVTAVAEALNAEHRAKPTLAAVASGDETGGYGGLDGGLRGTALACLVGGSAAGDGDGALETGDLGGWVSGMGGIFMEGKGGSVEGDGAKKEKIE
ncbi:hypothetical protein BPAE_0218g00080 [Botrytis paeoniae]|uniref:Uncharacterized protein n=1 Tax=Botrytis paeoniae TaxID=278948 RepID=A0A4Z1FA67_9HELO|nr:hypothetical protein BPAE_0218g00080 [Botrytis paeoniae]